VGNPVHHSFFLHSCFFARLLPYASQASFSNEVLAASRASSSPICSVESRQDHPMEDAPVKPFLFRLQLEHTPSPNDPPGARAFYRALGIMIVAWGRLEGHFLSCILVIMATEATRGLARKTPTAWEERTRIWKDAFRISPALKPHEPAALKFLTEIQDVAKDRHAIVHGLWERFNPISPTSPLSPISAGIVLIKHKKGTKDDIDFRRATFTIGQIREIAQKANRLNMELQTLTSILNAERGQPPQDVQTL
jgi:hypothetical protein